MATSFRERTTSTTGKEQAWGREGLQLPGRRGGPLGYFWPPGSSAQRPRGHLRASAPSSWRRSESLKQTVPWEQTSVTSEPNTDGRARPRPCTQTQTQPRVECGCRQWGEAALGLYVRASEKRESASPRSGNIGASWLLLQEQPSFSGKSPRRRKEGGRYTVSGDTARPASGTVTATAGRGMGRKSPHLHPSSFRDQEHRGHADPAVGLTGWNAAAVPAPATGHPPSAIQGKGTSSCQPCTGLSFCFFSPRHKGLHIHPRSLPSILPAVCA